MIYTVGIKNNYDKYLAHFSLLQKAKGGSVWFDYTSAKQYTMEHPEYGVYGVLALWEKTEKTPYEWNMLMEDSLLVRI